MPINNPILIGTTINNRYRIVNLLGQGGFGAVYRAWDTHLNNPCALKENFDTSPEAQHQFEHEALILANLHHANLPRVTDHFSLPGQGQYLVMDFVEGEDLQEKTDRTGFPLPESQVLSWIFQVLDALEYLHSRLPPVIHRDIKPANVRITPDGTAMLVDFGIAKLYDPLKKTTLGARAVTPGYSPFEQYGQKPTDVRTDIYALGATLYTLLTCVQPIDCIDRVAGNNLPTPRSLNLSITANTELAILKAMEIYPDKRFQTAAEFAAALQPGAFRPASPTFSNGSAVATISGTTQPKQTLPDRIPASPEYKLSRRKIAIVTVCIFVIVACLSSLILYNYINGLVIIPGTSTPTITATETLFPSPTIAASPMILIQPTNTLPPTETVMAETPTATITPFSDTPTIIPSTRTLIPLLPSRTPTRTTRRPPKPPTPCAYPPCP